MRLQNDASKAQQRLEEVESLNHEKDMAINDLKHKLQS